LGQLVTIKGGGTPRKDEIAYWDGDIPWATVKDLTGDELAATQDTISEKGLHNSAANLIPAESILIATRMALGKVAINGGVEFPV
jgi:type I restriction enzyme S subunit